MKKLIFSIVHWKQELKNIIDQYSKNENNLYHYIILQQQNRGIEKP